MSIDILPCADANQLRAYIDEHWRRGHVLAVDEGMFAFTYMTPWVDRDVFPAGISALAAMDGGRMAGFLGAICAPYPQQRSYWLALWHVLPDLKGSGVGGRLLAQMQDIALKNKHGWIGTFGAGPEALPVYLKRNYVARAARRWVFDPDAPSERAPVRAPRAASELTPDEAWLDFRFNQHPAFTYEHCGGCIFRTEDNEFGKVTHAVHLADESDQAVREIAEREGERAAAAGQQYLMDAWAFECPGAGWRKAPDDLPSVFHPPAARSSITYAVGYPFIPSRIHKGDCDQDRPNVAAQLASANNRAAAPLA